MNSILEKYQFFLTIPGTGQVQVYPCNNELEFTWKFYDKFGFWRKELKTVLNFGDDANHTTFSSLYTLEKQTGVCFKVDLLIKQNRNGTWTDHWNGYLPFKKGEWDLSRMIAKLKPRVEDDVNCIMDVWKTKVNLLDIEERVTIGNFLGDIECSDFIYVVDVTDVSLNNLYSIADSNKPEGAGWTTTELALVLRASNFGIITNSLSARYCREKVTSPPTDLTGWIQDGGDYYRPLPIDPSKYTKTVNATGNLGALTTYKYEYVNLDIDNAVRLSDVLDFLYGGCGYTIVSNFYGINADSTNPTNIAYDNAALYNQNIAFSQTSDVILPDADTNARLMETSLEKFWNDLSKRHRVEVWYDTVSSVLRIEHISYRKNVRMLDLTEATPLTQLKGNKKYSYNDIDFPLAEYYKDKIETNNRDFNDASILYNVVCSNDDIDLAEDDTTEMEILVTDLQALYNNQTFREDDDALFSITMYSLDANDLIISSFGALTGDLVLNAPQSWANCIAWYHLHDRPVINGTMNGKSQIFLDTIPQRKQEPLEFMFSATDWNTFNPRDKVRTQLGWGFVKEASYIEPYGILKIELEFK